MILIGTTIKAAVCVTVMSCLIAALPQDVHGPLLIGNESPILCSDDGGTRKTGGSLVASFGQTLGYGFAQTNAPDSEAIKVNVGFLMDKLGVKDPRSIGVLLDVKDRGVFLKGLKLELYSVKGEKLLSTNLKCEGCMKDYKPLKPVKGHSSGYLFKLDESAAALLSKAFAAENVITVTSQISDTNDAGWVVIDIVNLTKCTPFKTEGTP